MRSAPKSPFTEMLYWSILWEKESKRNLYSGSQYSEVCGQFLSSLSLLPVTNTVTHQGWVSQGTVKKQIQMIHLYLEFGARNIFYTAIQACFNQ